MAQEVHFLGSFIRDTVFVEAPNFEAEIHSCLQPCSIPFANRFFEKDGVLASGNRRPFEIFDRGFVNRREESVVDLPLDKRLFGFIELDSRTGEVGRAIEFKPAVFVAGVSMFEE